MYSVSARVFLNNMKYLYRSITDTADRDTDCDVGSLGCRSSFLPWPDPETCDINIKLRRRDEDSLKKTLGSNTSTKLSKSAFRSKSDMYVRTVCTV